MGTVTTLLESSRQGAPLDMGRLFELLYPEIKRIAHARLRHRDERSLVETGMLIHEAYLRLLGTHTLNAQCRGQFLAYVGQVMRSVVVDLARGQHSARRGGGLAQFVTLDTAAQATAQEQGEDEILRVDQALALLARIEPRLAQVVEQRYFAGLDSQRIADGLGVTVRTVERDWQKARAFLHHQLSKA